MPKNSILIVDDSIPIGYWSKDDDLYTAVERLELFIIWRGKGAAKILNSHWNSFKEKIDKISTEDIDEKKEIKEIVKAFIETQKYIDEDDSLDSKHNLIQLTKALTPLGDVIVISNKFGEDKQFDDSIGKAKVFTVEQFNQLVDQKCPDFYEYIGETFFKSSV